MVRFLPIIPFAVLLSCYGFSGIVPAEDAHIMFRYAQNLAAGRGLVWNEGEHVEGATEFLWTVILAGAIVTGMNPVRVAVGMGMMATAVVVLVLVFVNKRWGWLAATVYASSPVTIQAMSGFGTPVYGLALVWLAWSYSRRKEAHLALSGLCTALIRPEGAIIAVVGMGLYWWEHRSGLKEMIRFFVLPGLIYFVARWQYYGYFLPNTFYAKHGGEMLHVSGLHVTMLYYLYILPVLLFARRNRLWWVLALAPFMYLSIEQMQNIGMRFQFSYLAPLALSVDLSRMPWLRYVRYPAIVTVCAGMLYLHWNSATEWDERYYIGQSLRGMNMTMMATEAGWLPYYSGWRAYDPVGLYDSEIAHKGITEEYLDRISPDLIMWRSHCNVYRDGTPMGVWSGEVRWNDIVETLYRYARTREYLLVAVIGHSLDNRWYWVKREFKMREVVQVILKYKPEKVSAHHFVGLP